MMGDVLAEVQMSELADHPPKPDSFKENKQRSLKPNKKWIRRIYFLLKIVFALAVLCKAIADFIPWIAKWLP
jgi:hypothetical protein